jgi:hypothetical protein
MAAGVGIAGWMFVSGCLSMVITQTFFKGILKKSTSQKLY